MRVVVALGGNALLKRGEPLEADVQQANIARAAEVLAVLATTHEILVTHGNGPQVGLLALQAAAYRAVRPYPLDVLDAESAGMIGYLLDQALSSRLPTRNVVTLITQIEVDPDDPAFRHPTKPIGPQYDEAEAQRLARERGWSIARDGAKWRRVVPSPEPVRILELGAIRTLTQAGAIVICAGGGGIPVVITAAGAVHGVEAVIDKDLAAALLAQRVGAQALLLLTDVDAVYRHWGSDAATPIRAVTVHKLREESFAPGSMQPKVEAACRFAEAGGVLAAIGRLEDAPALLRGACGTIVTRE
jgi:carbamate kinase